MGRNSKKREETGRNEKRKKMEETDISMKKREKREEKGWNRKNRKICEET